MSNSTIAASKFFGTVHKTYKETIHFIEEDFDSLDQFKIAIASQIKTLQEQNACLTWIHKSFKTGDAWSFNLNQLNKYCIMHKCKLIQNGKFDNDYIWKVVPIKDLSVSEATPF